MRIPVSVTLLAFVWAGHLAASDPVLDPLLRHVDAHPGGEAAFTFDRNLNPPDRSELPIGVFDSGIGGLTVLQALLTSDAFDNTTLKPGADGRPDLENERFIYFGDQANMPYGNYPAASGTGYLRELILKDALFLLGKRYWPAPGSPDGPRYDKPTVKALVIACNTATAYGLEDLRQALASWRLPIFVVGVVEAGARGLLDTSATGAIGVLATRGTCASGVYPRTIEKTLRLAGRDAAPITQFGSAQLAAAIEGDPACPVPLAAQVDADVLALVEAHRSSASHDLPLSKIVLGCTHFPLALGQIDASFHRLRQDPRLAPFLAERMVYIDPARRTALDLVRQLAAAKVKRPPGAPPSAEPDLFFLSVPNPACPSVRTGAGGAFDPDYKFGRAAGHPEVEDSIAVPLSRSRLPPPSRALVESSLPAVWRRLPEN